MKYKELMELLNDPIMKSHKCFSEDDEIEVFDENGNFHKIKEVRQYDTGDLVIVLKPED